MLVSCCWLVDVGGMMYVCCYWWGAVGKMLIVG